MFGSPGEVVRFKIAVRSFPTPAVVLWPNGITLLYTSVPGEDVSVFDLSVVVEEDMTYTATARNGENGQLTSDIHVRVESRSTCVTYCLHTIGTSM